MAKSLDDLKSDIEALRRQYTDLTNRPAALFNVSNITDAQSAVDALTTQIENAQKQAADLEAGFGGIYKTIQGIVAELKKGNEPINLATRAFKNIQDTTQKLYLNQAGVNRLTSDELKTLTSKLEGQQTIARTQAAQLVEQKQSLLNDRNGNALRGAALSQRLNALVVAENLTEQEVAMIRAAKEGFSIFEETNGKLKEALELREKEEEEVRKILGLSGALLGTLGKIPVIGESAAKAYAKIKKEVEDAQAAGQELPTKMQVFGKVLKETGKGIVQNLKDPLVLVGGLVTALVKGFLDSDKATTGLQKNLTISKGEALLLNAQFTAATSNLDDMFISSRDMIKSFGALQDRLGSVGEVIAESAETFARLNKLVGLTEDEAAGLQAQSAAFGKDSNEVYMSQLKTTHQLSQQYKTQINQKAVLAEVGKASAYTLVQFRGSTQALTEAVAKSKALGVSMETLSKISSGLLDFQSSIENELSAELLTGKQLNLEQARYYALTNQQSKLMGELNTQIGTFSDYSNMNVLQQEAYAKALGMSSNELSEMLFKQEYRNKTEKEIAEIGDEDLRKRVEALTLQDKFQAATDKLSATFADFVAGPIGSFLTSMQGIYTVIGLIGGAALGKMISQTIVAVALNRTLAALSRQQAVNNIADASAEAGKSAGSVPGVGWLIALPAALAVAGGLIGLLTANDLFSPGQGGSGYGKRTLLAPEGAYKLNDNDNIIATTNPVNVNDMISGPKGSIRSQGQTTQAQPTKSEISITPGNTQINLNLNGAAIGNANARQDYGVGRGSKTFGGAVDYSAPI